MIPDESHNGSEEMERVGPTEHFTRLSMMPHLTLRAAIMCGASYRQPTIARPRADAPLNMSKYTLGTPNCACCAR